MGFKCGIIGLPNVGKSTLFNALTESSKAEAANYPFATIEPNIGRVPVPDIRLNKLSKIANSKSIIPTFIDFVDIAGLVKGASNGEGLGNKFLSHIREVDAIAHVVRCFEDSNIAHVSENINPIKDIETILNELKLSDLETLQNKEESIKKKSKSGDKKLLSQLNLIKNIENRILNDNLVDIVLDQDEKIFYDSLNLLSFKPMLYVCNVDEKSILNGNNFSNEVKKRAQSESNQFVIVSASIEAQIAEFDEEKDKIDMLNELGLKETTLNKVIFSGYKLLKLITFFTVGPKETRAWTVKENSNASEAAGKIHSDFQKGFIRAETISYTDFINYDGESKCREFGKLRQEGKDYLVKDGDIFHFLFNV